jgi:hypothetical protein
MKKPYEQRPEQAAQGASGQPKVDKTKSSSDINKQQPQRPVNEPVAGEEVRRPIRPSQRQLLAQVTQPTPPPFNEPVTRAVFRRHTDSQLAFLRGIFLAQPLKLLPAPWLAAEAHSIALHSRISDLRKKYGMKLRNKMSRIIKDGVAVPVSHYYYVPRGAVDPCPPQPTKPDEL